MLRLDCAFEERIMPVDSDVLKYRIREVRSSISELINLTSKPFEDLVINEKYAIRYLIIVLVEAIISLCTHVLIEAYNKTPETYREAVRLIGNRLGIKCVRELEALVALRNLLVHRYWNIDDRKIYESIKGNFRCLEHFLKRIEEEFMK